jgi:hypothetical protein
VDSVCCSDKGIAMSSLEKKIVVPAHPGFYVLFPVIEEKPVERVVDADYEPVVAWEIISVDGVNIVQPVAFGGSTRFITDGNYEVLCPNGTIVSENESWANLKDWIFSKNADIHKKRTLREKQKQV